MDVPNNHEQLRRIAENNRGPVFRGRTFRDPNDDDDPIRRLHEKFVRARFFATDVIKYLIFLFLAGIGFWYGLKVLLLMLITM